MILFSGDAALHVLSDPIFIKFPNVQFHIHNDFLVDICKYIVKSLNHKDRFPQVKNPILSKIISKIALHLARLFNPSLVIPTNIVPKVNCFITEPTGNVRISPSVNVVIGIKNNVPLHYSVLNVPS